MEFTIAAGRILQITHIFFVPPLCETTAMTGGDYFNPEIKPPRGICEHWALLTPMPRRIIKFGGGLFPDKNWGEFYFLGHPVDFFASYLCQGSFFASYTVVFLVSLPMYLTKKTRVFHKGGGLEGQIGTIKNAKG